MSTKFLSPGWRMPRNANQSKQSNYSMNFDAASSDYIDFTGLPDFGGGSLSISFWIKSGIDSSNAYVLMRSGFSFYIFQSGTASNLRYRIQTSSLNTINGGAILDNNWHHCVMTFDSTANEFKVFEDGNQVGSTVTTSGSLASSTSNVYLATYATGAPFKSGQFDGLSFFNYALSSSQVTTLYGSSSTGIGNPMSLSPKPVAYYPLGDQDAFNGANYLVPNSSLKDYVFDGLPGGTKLINSNINQSNTGGKFTISFWQKRSNSGIIKFNHGGTAIGEFTSFSNRPIVYLASNYFQYFDVPTVEIGVWKHYVVFMDTSNITNSKLWVNGTSINQSNAHTTGSANSFTSGLQLNLDRYPEISNMMYFTNYEIDQTNVDVLYNNGSPITSTSGLSTAPDHWWKLNASDTYDSSTGNWTIQDHAGSNDGTSSGMTQANLVQSDLSFTSGYSPYALDFDGTNDYITISGATNLNISGDLTMSMWFKANSFTNYEYIFRLGSGTTINGDRMIGFKNSKISTNTYADTSGAYDVLGNTTLSTGVWYHVAIVYSSNTVIIYLNGNADSSSIPTTMGTISYVNTTIAQSYNSNYFDGSISNCSIWNTALTSAQVTEIYNEGVPSNLNNHSAYSNLVSWWQLGSNSSFNTNWTVLDEKGSNNGTSTGMPVGALTNGVGTTANGVSSGMSEGSLVGDAPYSTANALSTNMVITSRVSGVSDATITTGGTGYSTGTNIATTGGSGTNCTINITTVSGGAITAITINSGGNNYLIGDVLTVSGGNGNATITVSGLNTP